MTEHPLLEEITIGFIGIGSDGSVGTEAVQKDYILSIDAVKKVYVKNRDTPESISAIGDEFIRKELRENNSRVEYGSVRKMVQDCDIIITAFERSCGSKTGKNIPIDDKFRQRLFNANKDVLYELKESLSKFNGLIINATNPLEGMCYWMLQLIPELSSDQVIGFMPDTDRFNELCKQAYEDVSKADACLSADEIDFVGRGFVFGEHSPNLVGLFSSIGYTEHDAKNKRPCGALGRQGWNGMDLLRAKNSAIVEDTVKWGLDLFSRRGATGKDVRHSLTNLVKRILNEANGTLSEEEANRFCTQTHYINLPYALRQEIPEKYRSLVSGICTGVPVNFRLVKGRKKKSVLRAILDPRYSKGDQNFNFERLSNTERAQALDCIRKTLFGEEK